MVDENLQNFIKKNFTYNMITRTWAGNNNPNNEIGPDHWAWFGPFEEEARRLGQEYAAHLAKKINSELSSSKVSTSDQELIDHWVQMTPDYEPKSTKEYIKFLEDSFSKLTEKNQQLQMSLSTQQKVNQWLIDQVTMWAEKYKEDMNDLAKMVWEWGQVGKCKEII